MKKAIYSLAIVSSILLAGNTSPNNLSVNKKTVTKTKKTVNSTYNFDVEFKAGSATLVSAYKPKIKTFAEFLKKHPKYKAVIIGYTDNKGNKKYNLLLSQKRAKAVYTELLKDGISKKRLSYKGEGGLHPIASNKTSKGREKNRRVIAVIIKK
jgi:OOP family OmpA-OmpF porin